jgi:hypothetical protein
LVRFAPGEVRFPEVRPAEVSLAEVWTNERFFCPPSVPFFDASLEKFEMLWVGH